MTAYEFTYGGYNTETEHCRSIQRTSGRQAHSKAVILAFPSARISALPMKKERNNRLLMILFAVFLAACMLMASLMLTARTTDAGTGKASGKVYESCLVEDGDTLFGIAESHNGDEYSDLRAYVSEVKKINHLDSDTIHAGMNLVIPYDTEE